MICAISTSTGVAVLIYADEEEMSPIAAVSSNICYKFTVNVYEFSHSKKFLLRAINRDQ